MVLFPNKSFNYFRTLFLLWLTLVCSWYGSSQSTLQDHPTPITRNEIAGTIKPRDLGDARLTTHYFWFDGSQGDVFINLTSKNFAGDIDVFAQNGLKTLTKIIVYADFGEVETGRVIYLRKNERLLLRVQGRSPNDEPATYRFKFAGSFVAATGDESDVPELPKVSENAISGVPVNSAGTKLQPPKPIEKAVETETEAAKRSETVRTDESGNKTEAVIDDSERKAETKPEVVVSDPVKENAGEKTTTVAKRPPSRARPAKTNPPRAVQTAKADDQKPIETKEPLKSVLASEEKKVKEASILEKAVDPLANVHLVILFKDGGKIERPLTEVQRFSVDRGVLTVVSKNGTTGKYQMLEVAKVTIE